MDNVNNDNDNNCVLRTGTSSSHGPKVINSQQPAMLLSLSAGEWCSCCYRRCIAMRVAVIIVVATAAAAVFVVVAAVAVIVVVVVGDDDDDDDDDLFLIVVVVIVTFTSLSLSLSSFFCLAACFCRIRDGCRFCEVVGFVFCFFLFFCSFYR